MSQELVTLSHNPVALSEMDGSRRYYRSGLLVLLLLVGGLGSWSVLADLSGAVIAPGKVTVESSRETVQHLDGGIVSAITSSSSPSPSASPSPSPSPAAP